MTDEDLTDALGSFGLTSKEIDTYLAILESGETTASAVAAQAGVSKRHIYNTAVRLKKRKFVEINDFVTPTKLRPVPPDRVEEQLHAEVETLHGQLVDRFNRSEKDFENVEVLKSRATLVKRMQQLVDEAEVNTSIAIPTSLLSDLESHLSAAVERDVFVLLIVYEETDEAEYGSDISLEGVAHAVRVRWDPLPIQLTVDRNFGLVAPRTLLSNPRTETQAIAFGQPYIEPVISGSFLSNEWQFAEELYVNPPEPLPKTYSHFRFATMQATIHTHHGTDLHATVEARPTDDPGPTKWLEGEVVDIRQQLIDPMKGSVIENAIDLRTDDGIVSVGGNSAFLEDYEAVTIRFERREM
ncbi:TrmB family transcriptional regulator sugar-binding domain-containing protein [Halomontanus rarus]|uniref:TrmB family transcriptional regulator sugar-binding domain-containing protein n=1 Tax=Halomontanus rarus TaxID=3034020 RepID=UPI0023E8EEE0|nr:TrmB family transcriptional regulator sugar-binding domain-containing protein [Halovivax sp. TS33]